MKRKALKITLFSIVGVLITLTVVGFVFQDRIIDAAMYSLRKNIRSRITIGDASFSLIKDFPYASIQLKDVSILSTKDINRAEFGKVYSADTMLNAGMLNLKLNVIDLFRNKITIKQVSLKNAKLLLLIDREGANNFNIIRKGSTGEGEKVSLNIDGIRINSSDIRIIDLNKRMTLYTTIKSFRSNGQFSPSQFNVKSKSQLTINRLSFNRVDYIVNREFSFSGGVKSKSFNNYDFKDFTLSYKNNEIKINGGFSVEKKLYVDVTASGENISLNDINELIPRINDKLKKVNFEGNANLKSKITGYWTGMQWPFIYGEFDVKGGKSEILKDNSIASVNLVGSFSNGKGQIGSSFVRIESFKINSSFGDFEGKFTLTNFNKPLISLSTNFNIFLNNLNKAYKIDSSNVMDGTIIGNLTADGNVNFDSLSTLRLIRLVNNGNFKFSEVKYPFRGATYSIRKGEAFFSPNTAKANLNFSSNSINGNISVSIDNFYDGVMESMPFDGSITANTSSLDFDKLLEMNFSSDKKKDSKELNVANLTFDVKSTNAILRGIPIHNLNAKLEKNGPLITINQLKGNSLGGSINLFGKLELNSDKTISTDVYAKVDSINIERLFSSFKNFNQKTITSDNIKGIGSGDITFRGQLTDQGILMPKTIECVSDITISNGRLVKFAPALKLSKYIDVKELEDIHFSTLKNQISIKSGTIYIPSMYVGSTAINLGIVGTHTFEGVYSYKVRLALKDVLFKRARSGLKKQVSQSDFENNTLLYFKITGDSKKSDVSYDWSGSKSWDQPLQSVPESQKPEVKSASAKPYTVTWDESGTDKSSAPSVATRKVQAEQPSGGSYKEEKEAEKKMNQKKEEQKKGFKVQWEDE